MQQWILARPEMREFLGDARDGAYPEPWMDRVDAIKTLQGWTDTSVMHFRDLAVFGEQILLSRPLRRLEHGQRCRRGANWARYWRSEIQGYIHAYRDRHRRRSDGGRDRPEVGRHAVHAAVGPPAQPPALAGGPALTWRARARRRRTSHRLSISVSPTPASPCNGQRYRLEPRRSCAARPMQRGRRRASLPWWAVGERWS